MTVKRHPNEYLGTLFPIVEVAQHPKLGENGAACIFRISFPEMPDKPVLGELNAEGHIKLDRISAITLEGRQALQAVAAQTLAAVLVPRYLEMFPPKTKSGFKIIYTGEVWASRPVIHLLGELREDLNENEQRISGGSRIHPEIARRLFAWLLDEELDCPFRLFREIKKLVHGVQEIYFTTWRKAKDELRARNANLSDAYIRTVRAYTRPVSVFINQGGDIVVQQMSNRAMRNYERFRSDIGRELDLSPVRKTYLLLGEKRIVLNVPRTFNQGTFDSLAEVWKMIPDLSLKKRAEVFAF